MGHSGHILEVGLLRLLRSAFLLVKSLKNFEQNLLGDFTPSSFQVGEARESEVGVQLVSRRIERSPHCHSSTFQLDLALKTHDKQIYDL